MELVVSRPIEDTPRIPATRRHQLINQSSSSSFDSQKREDDPSTPAGYMVSASQPRASHASSKSVSRESMANVPLTAPTSGGSVAAVGTLHKSPPSVSSIASTVEAAGKKCCECCEVSGPQIPPGRLQASRCFDFLIFFPTLDIEKTLWCFRLFMNVCKNIFEPVERYEEIFHIYTGF